MKNVVSLNIGNRTLTLRELSSQQISELDAWVQEEHLIIATRAAEKCKTRAQRQMLLEAATVTASTLTFVSGVGAKLIATPKGLAMLLWTLSDEKKDFTPYDLQKDLFDPNNVNRVNAKLKQLNGNPKTKKRRRHRGSTKRSRNRKGKSSSN